MHAGLASVASERRDSGHEPTLASEDDHMTHAQYAVFELVLFPERFGVG
jgi:hypothetical protein